jgi:hypothetical protein
MHATENDITRPLAVTFATARQLSGLGLTSLWRLARERQIETVRVGRRTLITYRSLVRLLLPEVSETPQSRPGGQPRKSVAAPGREKELLA